MIDLDAYLARIGYDGPRTATLETLRAIHGLHPAAIPFENLDPLLGRPVPLDAASLERKMVRGRRGGYCFEQNLLFAHALRALGFTVEGLAGRVLLNRPEGVVTGRSHAVLKVILPEGPHICDVGFGSMTLTVPMRFVPGIEQETRQEPFRLIASGGIHTMQAKTADGWISLYRFDAAEHGQIDYEILNWYVATHPSSYFANAVAAARSTDAVRYGLRDTRFTIRRRGTTPEVREIADAAEATRLLDEYFGITVPDDAAFAKAWARVAAAQGSDSSLV
jgi:N-hydroxyarylamine O-acetyltransferase